MKVKPFEIIVWSLMIVGMVSLFYFSVKLSNKESNRKMGICKERCEGKGKKFNENKTEIYINAGISDVDKFCFCKEEWREKNYGDS